MPKVAKNVQPKKQAGGAKKAKIYSMPEKIPEGTVLTDMHKRKWRVGPSIGVGGFGEIYTACKDDERGYNYVVKCEPHENGPLFVEMHFYMRNGKEADLKDYQKKHGLKSLGMPFMISNGKVNLNGLDHRFIIMPRYGQNIEHYFVKNGRSLPIGTVYRLAIQMLDVLEYVHQCGYIHADLKSSNMLLGLGKNGNSQAYLVDFGLASRYYADRDFKPDPKKAHNGTIEYTSRDAHQGVPTMRADLEILGYNLIHWSGAELPWIRDKLLQVPTKVQAAKIEFMSHLDTELRKLFPQGSVPGPLLEYLKYVGKLNYNETPEYKKCRKIFQDALKALKIPDTGDLELEAKMTGRTTAAVKNKTVKGKPKAIEVQDSSDVDDDESSPQRLASEDDDGDVVFETKPKRKTKLGTLKPVKILKSPQQKTKPEVSPTKRVQHNSSPRKRISPRTPLASSPSPQRKKLKTTPPTSSKKATPLTAKAKINFSPAISVAKKSSSVSRPGTTIVNDNVTPNPRAGKTYEFNFELDVSMDANVVVNVKRKKKAPAVFSSQGTPKSSQSTATSNGNNDTPVTRVKVQKVNDENKSSPRTPAVTVKKVKRVLSPR